MINPRIEMQCYQLEADELRHFEVTTSISDFSPPRELICNIVGPNNRPTGYLLYAIRTGKWSVKSLMQTGVW